MSEKNKYILVGLIILLFGVIVTNIIFNNNDNVQDPVENEEVDNDFNSREYALSLAQFYGGEEFEYKILDELENGNFIVEVINPETGRVVQIYNINPETGILSESHGEIYSDFE